MDVLRNRKRITARLPIGQYLDHLKTLKYSEKSINSYKQALGRFVSFLTAKDIARPADVTSKDLDGYRLELVDQGYADQSISLYLRSVRGLFKYLEDTGQVFIDPAASLIIPRGKAQIKPVPTEEEMQSLLSQPDISQPTGIRDRAVIETFYSTGARLAELCGMNVYDTDLKQGRVKITGKGSKQRVVPMGRQAVFWTHKYLKQVRPKFLRKRPDEHALWIGFAGKRINQLIVERFISDYGKKAGIRHPVTPHALRRACATHMLRGGAHPVEIQMLLGHGSLRVLSRYLKVTIADMMKTHSRGRPGK
jgi:integrase/recombinase XerD